MKGPLQLTRQGSGGRCRVGFPEGVSAVMSTTLVGAALVAVFAAVLVTLAMEYVVKPVLEARKDRVLGALREQRELLAVTLELSMAARALLLEIPATADREVRESFRSERERQYGRIQGLVRRLFDGVSGYAAAYPGEVRDLAIEYVMCLHCLTMSRRSRQAQAELIVSLAGPATRVFEPRLWPLRVRPGTVAELRRRLAVIGVPAE
jgi:hypothetical protein